MLVVTASCVATCTSTLFEKIALEQSPPMLRPKFGQTDNAAIGQACGGERVQTTGFSL